VQLDEGASEIDVVIEAPSWVWFIEAKYRSDISLGTTNRPERDQILRNVDVGSYYAGVRDFYFSLLVKSPKASPEGSRVAAEYADLSIPRQELTAHRPDDLANLQGISLLTWATLALVLEQAGRLAGREDEREYAARAYKWMVSKNLT
jgi:hypothetical protein